MKHLDLALLPFVISFALAALPLTASHVSAEIWSCRNSDSNSRVYLEQSSPSTGIEGGALSGKLADCQPAASLARTTFNKLHSSAAESEIEGEPTTPTTNAVLSKSRLLEPRVPGREIYTSWEARKLIQRRKTKRRTLEKELCEITGVARGQQGGYALLTITRGALTVEQKRLRLKKDGAATVWRMQLKGSCRNPSVEIVRHPNTEE